jgi:hypothetical protein
MIGPKTMVAVSDAIAGLLRENQSAIDGAYETAGELGLSIAAKFGKVGARGVDCTVSLTFVKEKIKAETKFQYDEDQLPIDFDVKVVQGQPVPYASSRREAEGLF